MVLALLAFGSAAAVGVPPCQAPDEGYNFLRAYHVASGHLRPELVDGWGGGRFPPAPVRVVELGGPLVGRPDRKFTPADRDVLASLDNGGELRVVAYPTAAPYTFVPFLPQAAGIGLARQRGLAPLATFYAGRFANLLFGTALVGLALTLAPVGRRFLGMVALMPMTVHLFGSYAPDVGVVGATLVLLALVFRLVAADGRRAAGWELAGLAAIAAGLAASKPPYLPLVVLVLAVPADRFGGPWRRSLVVGGLVATGLAVAAVGAHLTRPYYPDPNDLFGFPTSVRGQTEFVAAHPARFLEVFATTVGRQGFAACFRLYTLGWVDTPLDPVAVSCHALLLGLVGAAARAELKTRPPRWPAVAGVGGGLVLVVLSMYLWCTPVGASTALGLHGRYLLPLVPALPFLLPHQMGYIITSDRISRSVAGAAAVLILLTASGAVVTRYYSATPCPWPGVFPILLAGLAAGVIARGLLGRVRPQCRYLSGHPAVTLTAPSPRK
ncbi:MAG: Protein of unknown function rane [Gemmataceae bacterium]|nr:Protein of unknown function rane [Gemmataceae bacterium]